MTELLQEAFEEASKLPQEEQDAMAQWILAELASERKWDEAFASSSDILAQLADAALEDYEQGRTTPIEPDKL
ncbi:MAG: hypothetical protein ABI670_14520 [Chloroflexota bacterium]